MNYIEQTFFDIPEKPFKKHLKILIGGSPCTHWSIAQSKNRETTASGIGWELFKNYLYARDKFKPDYFLYENNKSAAQPIKDQISRELGVNLQYINSALVSAQNRERFYAHNIPFVPQPEDREILLKDVLDSVGAKTGLYACPINDVAVFTLPHGYQKGIMSYNKAPTLTTGTAIRQQNPVIVPYQGEELDETKYKIINKIYQVLNGLITIKDKQYPIKLPDGYYIIRKLTVNECRKLQTIPEWYKMPCSNSQNYKMLGNGWTVEVIKHILSHIPNIADCTIEVLSMYDGMSCGQIALTELGCKIERYVSYEIDKYCIQTTQANFPNTVQRGDAFAVRENNWAYNN